MGVLDLPLVIVRTIFEDIYYNDIKSFIRLRLVSKACRLESESLLFRTLVVNYKKGITTRGDLHILTRLQNPEDTLTEHIRHLQIGPYTDWEYYNDAIAPALEGVMVNLTKLQSLTWNSHLPIPLNILQTFCKKFPLAQLHVTNQDRRFPVPMPRSLLSSPQLHTLDITVYRMKGKSDHDYSEFEVLKECLIHGGSVKILRLATKSALQGTPTGDVHELDPGYGLQTWEGITFGPVNFQWKDGDRFPSLEELKLNCRNYHLSLEQCQMWVKCMDWGKLTKLDVGKATPRYLFESLIGSVPQLKSLTFGLLSVHGLNAHTWRYRDASTIDRFLESISALEELVLNVFRYSDFMAVLPITMQRLGHSLKRLDANCLSLNSTGSPWKEEQYVRLLEDCPKLIYLKLELRGQSVEKHWSNALAAGRAKYESMVVKKKFGIMQ